MSSIVDEVGRIQASRGPALKLVDHKWSALVLGSLRLSFGSSGAAIPAPRLHAQVDAYLGQLREAGLETPPQADGRSLCLSWVRESWLSRLPGEDGGEVYERTSHALTAERVVSTLGRDRSLLNESRLRTIVDAVHRWASEAQPDAASRIAELDDEIRSLQEERTRLENGGELLRADDERMRHGYTDVVDLLAQIPGDFRRVEESLDAIHRRMIHDFRTEERPQGEVLGSYLQAARELMTATPAGRAFQGALSILGDEERLGAFREDLRAIMDHPFAADLDARSRRDFLDVASVLRRGLYDVQARQHQASRSLADYLTHAEADQERELSTAIHRVQSELSVWAQAARSQDRVPLDGAPSRAEISHLRSRTDSLSPGPGAAPLQDVTASAPLAPDLEAVMRSGGPLVRQVSDALAALVGEHVVALPSVFNELPRELRRPVELFGLMQLATEKGLLAEDRTGSDFDAVVTVRPDGSTRTLRIPNVRIGSADLSAEPESDTGPLDAEFSDPAPSDPGGQDHEARESAVHREAEGLKK
ncbi:DUF3375 family protein [Galactobacter sp.]|uniref:DUF3375 family protein n=1 Tax=Galactobacter sp. TaxID=2676125 RepID=UPI0025C33D0A|nr:DUF3375 family protein [Galactobacter sp.]